MISETSVSVPVERLIASSTPEDKRLRAQRFISMGITDYSITDNHSLPYKDRVGFFRSLNENLHPDIVRTELRMKDLIDKKSQNSHVFVCNEEIASSYAHTLQAMREAGIKEIALVLFTPDTWMSKLSERNTTEFLTIYKGYLAKVLDICRDAGVSPSILQVMNEVNWAAQTSLGADQIVSLIQETKRMARASSVAKDTKIMTTFQINSLPFDDDKKSKIDTAIDALIKLASPQLPRWQHDIETVVAKAGDALDIVGIDYYPGSYDRPGFSWSKQPDLSKSHPFQSFSNVSPYRWIFEQKIHGFLKNKEIMIAETGVPTMTSESRWGQLGMGRIISALDLLLLEYQKKGYDANELLRGVLVFMGQDTPGIQAKTPRVGRDKFAIDATPWSVFRMRKGMLDLTEPGKRLVEMWNKKFRPNKVIEV